MRCAATLLTVDLNTLSVITNAGLFAVTVIAAIVAWRGVKDARDARDEAGAHEKKALGYSREAAAAATDTAAAQQRVAAALEHANLREIRRDASRVPWTVDKLTSERWGVKNNTGSDVDFVQFEARPPAHVEAEDGMQFRDVANGQSFFLRFGGGFADPASATVKVVWRDGFGKGQEALIILG